VNALSPTIEQQAILGAAGGGGGTVAISAAAGSGKTSTLRMIAAARPKTRMLYLAFNRAIADEAEGTFPPNVTCRTAHSLAYQQFGAQIRRRLNGPRRTGRQNAQALGISSPLGLDQDRCFSESALASMALAMVARFCRSGDEEMGVWHFRPPEGLAPAEEKAVAKYLLPYAERAWADLTCGERGRLKPTHDVYLKQWQLSWPRLSGWDVILYDEAQDADPCISAVVEAQRHAQLIAVGDSAQAIYGWRGAGDFLARLDADHRLALTQSWRFGQAVADEANVWLQVVGAEIKVMGNPDRDSIIAPLDTPDAVLCRSNAGTIEQLLAAHDTGVKVHLVGGGKEMVALAEAARRLQDGRPAAHPELVAFNTWQQVVEYAENDPGGSDLAVAVKMIKRYGAAEVIRAVNGTVPAGGADLRVSTAHKAKGLEWERVRIAGDFRDPLDKTTGQPLTISQGEAMLAYVAVTRAKAVLDNGGLAWVHGHLETLGRPAGLPARESVSPGPAAPCVEPPGKNEVSHRRRREGSTATPPTTTSPSRSRRRRRHVDSRTLAAQEEYLARYGLCFEVPILVAEEQGTFWIHGVSKDGSVLAYRHDGLGGARNFRPEWCCSAVRQGKAGRPVRVRSVPPEARVARAAWKARYGSHYCSEAIPVRQFDVLGINT
jgi:hypothetical protein